MSKNKITQIHVFYSTHREQDIYKEKSDVPAVTFDRERGCTRKFSNVGYCSLRRLSNVFYGIGTIVPHSDGYEWRRVSDYAQN